MAADDPLTNSRSDIAEMVMQKRMDERQTREQRKAQKSVSGGPYGPKGLLHPSAPNLFFTKSAIDKLLSTGFRHSSSMDEGLRATLEYFRGPGANRDLR